MLLLDPVVKPKERPILFQGAMVRALLAGTKAQTRRAVRVQPGPSCCIEEGMPGEAPFMYSQLHGDGPGHDVHERRSPCVCPYGQPGERIWVRETFFAFGRWVTQFSEEKGRDEWHFIDMTLECGLAYGFAEELRFAEMRKLAPKGGAAPTWWKRPAIFMPRAASRILLELTDVRVERLRQITAADVLAEGIVQLRDRGYGLPDGSFYLAADPCQSYYALFESINGAGSVQRNPWLWVLEFNRVHSC